MCVLCYFLICVGVCGVNDVCLMCCVVLIDVVWVCLDVCGCVLNYYYCWDRF